MKLTYITNTEYADIKETSSLTHKTESKMITRLHDLFIQSPTDIFWGWIDSDGDDTIQYNLYRKYFKKNSEELQDLKPATITQFCMELSRYTHEKELYNVGGQFLSALINEHFERTKTKEKYFLITENLEQNIDFLGLFGKANIEIKGNVGRNAGAHLAGGKITIYGNAWTNLGKEMSDGEIILFGDEKTKDKKIQNQKIVLLGNAGMNVGENMRGGKITINGTAGDSLGINMKSGTIIANGQVGHNIGHCMSGGEIYLNDTYQSIAHHFNSGKIYHKNKVIMSPFRNAIRKIKRKIFE